MRLLLRFLLLGASALILPSPPSRLRSAHRPAVPSARETFDLFDTDNSGTIDENELGKLLVILGADISAKDLGPIFRALDTDGDGGIDYEEFDSWYTPSVQELADERGPPDS